MITEFGKVLRKLRIDRGEILKTMADHLEITSSYLSAIECGKRNIPPDFIERLSNVYGLDQDQILVLNNARNKSLDSIEIKLDGISGPKRDLVLQFARKFNDMDEEVTQTLINFLRKDEEKD